MGAQHVGLRAVIFKSGEFWVGQCLEYDVAAQAKTPQELSYQLERAIVGHVAIAADNGLAVFQGVPAAPPRYWKMFEHGMKVEALEKHTFRVEGRSVSPQPELRLSELVPA